MGGGSGPPHQIPDWRSYKAEGIPQLDMLQRRLAAQGLKDPWIRNEVWRFRGQHAKMGIGKMGLKFTFRGLGIALAAMAVTVLYDKATNKGDDHGHH